VYSTAASNDGAAGETLCRRAGISSSSYFTSVTTSLPYAVKMLPCLLIDHHIMQGPRLPFCLAYCGDATGELQVVSGFA
jgi:hypothetical protein